MKKITNFLKEHKNIIIWTLFYVLAVFLIFLLIFGFNLFSPRHWSVLSGVHLRGFAGFAFGVFMVAVIPIYAAGITVMFRTKKPLFSVFSRKKEPKKEDEIKAVTDTSDFIPLPSEIPSELVGAFMRARKNIANRPTSAFDIKDIYRQDSENNDVIPHESPELPLPENFDFGATAETSYAPVFKNIDFSSSDEKETPLAEQSENLEYSTSEEITISEGMAIVTHSDPDFWIADEESWFAAGKQKTSPIIQVLSSAKKQGLSPVIYLAEKNIMDLDKHIVNWESLGIKVITDPEELKLDLSLKSEKKSA